MASTIRRLSCGVLFGVAAALLRTSLQPLMGDTLPFVVAFPATVAAAAMWGAGAGTLTAAICAVAVITPGFAPHLTGPGRSLQVGGFLAGGLVVSLFCGRLAMHTAPIERPVEGLPDGAIETQLTAWLKTVLWGAFLVPATAFLVVAWWGYERAVHDEQARVAHACDLAYQHAQRTFTIALEIAKRGDAATVGDDDAVRSREAQVHQRLADLTAGLPSVINLNVWDPNGRPIARSDLFPVDPRAIVADRTYFQQQRSAPLALGISEVLTGRQSGRELTNATIRRSSPDGSFRGIVAVSLSPAYFRDYYESLASEQPTLASFALIRTDGKTIARWPQSARTPASIPVVDPIAARIGAGDRFGTLTLPQNAVREARIASFRRLDDIPLYVVASVSRDAIVAGWMHFITLLAAILLPISAGLVCVTWIALAKTRRETATAAALQAQILRTASAEKSLLQAQRLETLAVVTGGVAHDFNNLLAVLSASLHILRRRHPELAHDKQAHAMGRAIQSGVRLTRQLLSFTRKQALRPETVELQAWLPANEGLLQSTLGASVTWRLEVDPDTAPVHLDLGELELALLNLVVNARHAMPGGGTLTVHAANVGAGPDGPMVALAVRDTGVGIPAELLDKVAEPFFTTRAKGAGSGLGLSQVQGFCTEAGGDMRIESSVGHGTTVSMILPAARQPVAVEVPDPPIRRLSGRVLLVEDNEDVGAATEAMLRAAGLVVVRLNDAAAALAHLAAAAPGPDVVFTDISMPGSMNGIELAFALRERHPGVPVLLTTGYAEQLDKAVAGGLRVLQKPVAPEDMLAELRALIGAGTQPASVGAAV